MTTLITFFLAWFIISAIFILMVVVSIWIHSNKRGTKIWNFVNKHIVADEDEILKK